MNSTDISKILHEYLTNVFIIVFNVLWSTNEFKSAVIGIPGGKILYYSINNFLVI